MEDLKAHSLSNEMINIGNLPVHRPLHEPDVPQDIDYVQQHLNDPYLDLRAYRPPSERSFTMRKKRNSYEQSEVESQFDRYSTSRAESRNSTAIEFDEYVSQWLCFNLSHYIIIILVNPHTLKFVPPSRVLMIRPCPSIHFACGSNFFYLLIYILTSQVQVVHWALLCFIRYLVEHDLQSAL